MLIPSFRFFVVPFATACTLVALAMTQPDTPRIEATAGPSAELTQACHLGGRGEPHRVCGRPAS